MLREKAATGKGMTPEALAEVARFFKDVSKSDKQSIDTKNFFFPDFVTGLIKPHRIDRGRVSCILSVLPAATNAYGGMHGGAVASVAETMSRACARTVVGEKKELFLGELSISYLSAAPVNAELRVDASVTRSGRNVTVVAAEFRSKDSGNLTYTSHATFYNMAMSSL